MKVTWKAAESTEKSSSRDVPGFGRMFPGDRLTAHAVPPVWSNLFPRVFTRARAQRESAGGEQRDTGTAGFTPESAGFDLVSGFAFFA